MESIGVKQRLYEAWILQAAVNYIRRAVRTFLLATNTHINVTFSFSGANSNTMTASLGFVSISTRPAPLALGKYNNTNILQKVVFVQVYPTKSDLCGGNCNCILVYLLSQKIAFLFVNYLAS